MKKKPMESTCLSLSGYTEGKLNVRLKRKDTSPVPKRVTSDKDEKQN